jgi:uncharacterized peroxidase-related enzyme
MPENDRRVFPGLGRDAGVRHALALNPDAGRLLAAYHEQILRGPSNLTVAERELIAAYVSGLNECDYCCGTHTCTAQYFGVAPGTVEALLGDETLSAAPAKLRPLLAYARKLTLNHRQISSDDAQAVFDVGWSGRDLHDLILVSCTFNFMNRLVHGHGIRGEYSLAGSRTLFVGTWVQGRREWCRRSAPFGRQPRMMRVRTVLSWCLFIDYNSSVNSL